MFENYLKELIKDEIINKIVLFCYINIVKDVLGKKKQNRKKIWSNEIVFLKMIQVDQI